MPNDQKAEWLTLDELWVFGYGSLMWRPGFDYVEMAPALLHGRHRSFCVYSVYHRGSVETPGLVLGLDVGGSCRGVAYRVARSNAREVREYLLAREQVTMVYEEAVRPLTLTVGDRIAKASGLCFIVDRSHNQYASGLSWSEQAAFIQSAVGQSGRNIDYFNATVDHLDSMGIADGPLHRLRPLVNGR